MQEVDQWMEEATVLIDGFVQTTAAAIRSAELACTLLANPGNVRRQTPDPHRHSARLPAQPSPAHGHSQLRSRDETTTRSRCTSMMQQQHACILYSVHTAMHGTYLGQLSLAAYIRIIGSDRGMGPRMPTLSLTARVQCHSTDSLACLLYY